MKTLRFPLIFSFLLLGSLLLSACSGAGVVNTWPSVAASKDTVYLADAGQVYAINATNGTMTWRYPAKADASKPFYAPPAVTDTLIVAGSYGHMLHGIGLDGTNKWDYDSQTGNFVGGPLIVKDTVIAPSSDNKVYALPVTSPDSANKLLWSYQAKNSLWATPVSDGQVVYVPGLDHTLYALNLADGKVVWKTDLGSALVSTPILTQDGTLYVNAMDGDVVAVKAADGSVLWKVNTGGRLWGPPVLHDGTLFVGDSVGESGGKLTAVSIQDKKVAWQKDLGSPILAGIALLPDGVVVTTEGGKVNAYSFTGEKDLWSQSVNGKLYSTPVVTGQTLVVAAMGGDKLIYTFNVANGQPSWTFVAPK
jgi:outer membrane protein assembly factor BamB